MSDDWRFHPDVARGNPCGVGTMATVEGDKVVLTLRDGLPDARPVWFDPALARELGAALIEVAEAVLAQESAALAQESDGAPVLN